MNSEELKLYEARANIIKALAHPSRLFIVDMLNRKPRTVGELTVMVGADTSTVSKHLSVLKNAGIVEDEKKGTAVIYSLKCPCILDFIGCIEDVIESNTKTQVEILSCCRTRRTV
ncbi:MAG TPA: metalloregulator ArsR/SmtB family transcription factor [Spirochaetota bacterium]|nr:metalloregulator ArsR/SmtB family transcription factor [Spirochaetota bacterium]HPJ35189.1 metalloregulator ArsR/SmtB family transcription factor [Spirochaetota bacterium]